MKTGDEVIYIGNVQIDNVRSDEKKYIKVGDRGIVDLNGIIVRFKPHKYEDKWFIVSKDEITDDIEHWKDAKVSRIIMKLQNDIRKKSVKIGFNKKDKEIKE